MVNKLRSIIENSNSVRVLELQLKVRPLGDCVLVAAEHVFPTCPSSLLEALGWESV